MVSNYYKVPDGGYGWVVCLIGSLIHAGIGGFEYSFGVILKPYADHYKASLSFVSFGGELAVIIQCLFGIVYANLAAKFGYQQVILVGCLASTLSFACCAMVSNIYLFVLTFCLIPGLGFGLGVTGSTLTINSYFDSKRAIANGIFSGASSLGTMVLSYVMNWIIQSIGIFYIPVLFAGVFAFFCGLTIFMKPYEHLEPRLLQESDSEDDQTVNFDSSDDERPFLERLKSFFHDFCAWRYIGTPHGLLFIASVIFFYIGLNMAIIYMVEIVTYRLDKPMNPENRGYILMAYSLANGFGRILAGCVTDWFKIGPQLVSSVGVLIGSACLTLMLTASSWTTLLLLVGLQGLFFSSFSGLRATSTIRLFGAKNMTKCIGMMYVAIGIGSIPGAPISGWIFEATGGYDWVIVSATACYFLSFLCNLTSHRLRRLNGTL